MTFDSTTCSRSYPIGSDLLISVSASCRILKWKLDKAREARAPSRAFTIVLVLSVEICICANASLTPGELFSLVARIVGIRRYETHSLTYTSLLRYDSGGEAGVSGPQKYLCPYR